jgi:hypothetical protein
MKSEPSPASSSDGRGRKRSVLRLVLGQLQIIGATVGFYFLLATGATKLTTTVLCITGGVTLLSFYLFRILWPDKS